MENKKFYITTAIAYASRKPHFGNTYEVIATDAIARYKRAMGYDVFFCTGTDEHGQKIENLASEAGITPQAYVDGVSGEIKKIWDLMGVKYDHFIRTTAGDRKGLEYDSFDGVPRGYEHAKHMGRKVAGAAIGIMDKTEPICSKGISFGYKEISIPSNQDNARLAEAKKINELYVAGRAHELPYEKMELTTVVAEASRIVMLENGPDAFPFVLSALKLGDFVLAGLPGECFVDIGRTIEAENGGASVFVCCLTNGGDTYFPTSSAYDEGGYEARSSRLKKGGDKILTDGMAELLCSIK